MNVIEDTLMKKKAKEKKGWIRGEESLASHLDHLVLEGQVCVASIVDEVRRTIDVRLCEDRVAVMKKEIRDVEVRLKLFVDTDGSKENAEKEKMRFILMTNRQDLSNQT